jgi:hypothetical protein
MRADMFEVIIERPRGGAGWLKEGNRIDRIRRRLDEAPIFEPMLRGWGTKHLNENLAPLVRFLRSRRGKPWNKVYSEMCERLRPTSAVQKHVLDHVRMMVEIHPIMKDGVPHRWIASGRRGSHLVPIGDYSRHAFYVCPKTGLFAEVPRKRKPVKKL